MHVVSFSGGKDSTAMLLRMIEENMPIDIILYCDTGLEFPEMEEHIGRLRSTSVVRLRYSSHLRPSIITEWNILA